MKQTIYLPCSIVLNNDIQEVKQLNVFVSDVCATVHLDDDTATNVELAIEEAVVNVMNYAYPYEWEGKIHVKAYASAGKLFFEISDSGIPFDPTKAKEADISLSVQQRSIGGLGIYLIRKYMDNMEYKRIEGRNVLTLSKNLNFPL